MYQQSYFHMTLYHIVSYNLILYYDLILNWVKNMLHYGFVSSDINCIAWYVLIKIMYRIYKVLYPTITLANKIRYFNKKKTQQTVKKSQNVKSIR